MAKLVHILVFLVVILGTAVAGPIATVDNDCECKYHEKLNITELLCKSKQLNAMPDFTNIACVFDKVVIASNDISVIANDSFINTPDLSIAHLYTNNIAIIEEDAFKSLPNLQEVDLSDNDLLTLDPWVFSDNLELQTVVLSNNPLVDVDVMSPILSSESVTTLLLDACKLTTITRKMLSELPNLEVLDISSNDISSLSLTVFDDVPKLKRLELHNNRWSCDCDLKYLLIFADRMRDDRSEPLEAVKCVTPERDLVVWSEIISQKYCPLGSVQFLENASVEDDDGDDVIVKMDTEIDLLSNDSSESDMDQSNDSVEVDRVYDDLVIESNTEVILLADETFFTNVAYYLDSIYSFLIILTLLIVTIVLTACIVRRVRKEQQALRTSPPTHRADNNVGNKFYMMNVHGNASSFASTDRLLTHEEHKPIVFQYPAARSNIQI